MNRLYTGLLLGSMLGASISCYIQKINKTPREKTACEYFEEQIMKYEEQNTKALFHLTRVKLSIEEQKKYTKMKDTSIDRLDILQKMKKEEKCMLKNE